MRQEQFLRVVSREEAERRFRAATDFSPLPAEEAPLAAALGRVLAEERTVGVRKVRCVRYEKRLTEADFEWQGTAYLSREIPGSLVWSEDEVRQKGAVVLTQRAEILEFGTK